MFEFYVCDKRSAAALDYAPAGCVVSVVGLGADIESKIRSVIDIDFRIGIANENIASIVVFDVRVISNIDTRITN